MLNMGLIIYDMMKNEEMNEWEELNLKTRE